MKIHSLDSCVYEWYDGNIEYFTAYAGTTVQQDKGRWTRETYDVRPIKGFNFSSRKVKL